MATLNLNKMLIYNKKHEAPSCHFIKKKTCLIDSFIDIAPVLPYSPKKFTLFYL